MFNPASSKSTFRLTELQSCKPIACSSILLSCPVNSIPLAARKNLCVDTQHFARHTSRRLSSSAVVNFMGRLTPKSPVPSDIEIAQEAVPVPIVQIAEQLGVQSNELEQYGHMKAKVSSDLSLSRGLYLKLSLCQKVK